MNLSQSITIISDEVSQEPADLIRFVKTFQLPGIELRSIFGRAFKDLTAADIAEIGRVAAGEGWKIFGCASPVFKCELEDAAAIETHLDQFRRSVVVARELKCDLIRVFTFLRRPGDENGARLPRVAAWLEKLEAIAAPAGVRLGVENEHSCAVATSAEVSKLFTLVSPRMGIVWDPCNPLYLPDATSNVTAGYASFASRILHIHIKDAARRRPAPGELPAVAAPVGLGDVGWRNHLAEIRRSGYRGMFSLETHWRVEALAEEALHLPAGYAFSRGGEEASRVCVRNLQALLELSA